MHNIKKFLTQHLSQDQIDTLEKTLGVDFDNPEQVEEKMSDSHFMTSLKEHLEGFGVDAEKVVSGIVDSSHNTVESAKNGIEDAFNNLKDRFDGDENSSHSDTNE